MARDTRGTSSHAKEQQSVAPPPANKRKRRSSPSPIPSSTTTTPSNPTPLKVVLPSPSSLQSQPSRQSTSSPTKPNGNNEPAKRQRISLKIGGAKANGASASPEKPTETDEGNEAGDENSGRHEEAEIPSNGLSRQVREALALVISQMAQGLPPPLNNILKLWLPPDFAQKPENTLGWILRQDDLTWESLVNTLHLFSENLLTPCSYPNPLPCLSQIHLPVPPLPAHHPPHVIYAFCASLRDIVLDLEPAERRGEQSGKDAERWALMQKIQGSGGAGEWFTSNVDLRGARAGLDKINKGKMEEGDRKTSLLEALAEKGDSFGHAAPVALTSGVAAGDSKGKGPSLSESIIRRASLKMNRWKEARAAKHGRFGDVSRPVTIPIASHTTWTPSFAPTWDSTYTGAGYWATLDGMHERARHKEWARRVLTPSRPGSDEAGWYGSMAEVPEEAGEEKASQGPRDVEEELERNAGLIQELLAWQEVRVRKGDESWVSEREHVVADELFGSLVRLAGTTDPASLVPESLRDTPAMAHALASRVIPVSSPVLRGTLDPRRPHALHDNTTVRLRPHAVSSLAAASSSPRSYLPPSSGAPSQASGAGAPPPHINSSMIANRYNPYGRPGPSSATPTPQRSYPAQAPPSSTTQQGSPFRPPSTGGYPPYSPSPAPGQGMVAQGNTIYGRHGPGPSALRQSFGPVAGGAAGAGGAGMYGMGGGGGYAR